MKIIKTHRDERGRVIAQRVDASEWTDGADGETAWIDIKVRMKGKHRRLGLEISRLSDKLNGNEELTAIQQAELVNEFRDIQYRLLNERVLAWNWVDGDGEPLPAPDEPDVFAELYEDDIEWIFDQIGELSRYQATEGNATSGDA